MATARSSSHSRSARLGSVAGICALGACFRRFWGLEGLRLAGNRLLSGGRPAVLAGGRPAGKVDGALWWGDGRSQMWGNAAYTPGAGLAVRVGKAGASAIGSSVSVADSRTA